MSTTYPFSPNQGMKVSLFCADHKGIVLSFLFTKWTLMIHWKNGSETQIMYVVSSHWIGIGMLFLVNQFDFKLGIRRMTSFRWSAYHDSESGFLKSTNSIHCSITFMKRGLTYRMILNLATICIVELRLYIVLDISGSLSMNLVVSWWMDL
jgi:hypothetical protein